MDRNAKVTMKLKDVYKGVKGGLNKTASTPKDIERFTTCVSLHRATDLKNGFIPVTVNECLDDINGLLVDMDARYEEYLGKRLKDLDLKERRRMELFIASIIDDAKEIVLNNRHLEAEVSLANGKTIYKADEKKALSPRYHDTEEWEERILETMQEEDAKEDAFYKDANAF